MLFIYLKNKYTPCILSNTKIFYQLITNSNYIDCVYYSVMQWQSKGFKNYSYFCLEIKNVKHEIHETNIIIYKYTSSLTLKLLKGDRSSIKNITFRKYWQDKIICSFATVMD